MKPVTQNKQKGPLDLSTLTYNTAYFPEKEDDLCLTIKEDSQTRYKFELGGLLVYDFKAKIVKTGEKTSDFLEVKETIDFKDKKKDISKSVHSGKP